MLCMPVTPMQVCGEEGRVEVLLVNPCATPLKLDGLQLQVQPHAPAQAQAATSHAAADSSGGSSGGSSGLAALQQRSVSVMLSAGSKPLRVVLGYTPSKAGPVAITGVQVRRAKMGSKPSASPLNLGYKRKAACC